MSKFTPKLIEAISDQNLEQADDYLHLIVQESLARTLNEDHELYMTSSQMKSHLGKLYNLAKDQSSFLKTLANHHKSHLHLKKRRASSEFLIVPTSIAQKFLLKFQNHPAKQ